eukprot:GHVH01002073.1.p1 GENE.GHVH01002073.1~~GHVH01002073.1.p1  ORF type:complete len:413 (+),score=56.76 GHVH01002073.1:190-1428(+)
MSKSRRDRSGDQEENSASSLMKPIPSLLPLPSPIQSPLYAHRDLRQQMPSSELANAEVELARYGNRRTSTLLLPATSNASPKLADALFGILPAGQTEFIDDGAEDFADGLLKSYLQPISRSTNMKGPSPPQRMSQAPSEKFLANGSSHKFKHRASFLHKGTDLQHMSTLRVNGEIALEQRAQIRAAYLNRSRRQKRNMGQSFDMPKPPPSNRSLDPQRRPSSRNSNNSFVSSSSFEARSYNPFSLRTSSGEEDDDHDTLFLPLVPEEDEDCVAEPDQSDNWRAFEDFFDEILDGSTKLGNSSEEFDESKFCGARRKRKGEKEKAREYVSSYDEDVDHRPAFLIKLAEIVKKYGLCWSDSMSTWCTLSLGFVLLFTATISLIGATSLFVFGFTGDMNWDKLGMLSNPLWNIVY